MYLGTEKKKKADPSEAVNYMETRPLKSLEILP